MEEVVVTVHQTGAFVEVLLVGTEGEEVDAGAGMCTMMLFN